MTRRTLYRDSELREGYDPADYRTFAQSFDFKTFLEFISKGSDSPRVFADWDAQARHDAGIGFATTEYMRKVLESGRSFVGVMGGHSLHRTDEGYRLIAELALKLTQHGYVVFSGGGPGAMEACHLGAYFANSTSTEFQAALADLAAYPNQPSYADAYDNATGALETGAKADAALKAISAWYNAALTACSRASGPPGESLAIPTWVWGSEPTNPFATCYAKFYQDGLREQNLIKLVQAGMVFAHGGGGTMRELFQLIENNYYATSPDKFIPMIFADPGDFWRRHPALAPNGDRTADYIDVRGVLQDTFDSGIADAGMREACMKKVVYTTDFNEILAVLSAQKPAADANLTTLVAHGGRALRENVSRRR